MIGKPLLIALLVLAGLFGIASFGLYKQVKANGILASRLADKEAQIKAGEELIAKERKLAAETSLRAQNFYEEKGRDDEELEKLRACYADKSCWPRVRVKPACPVSGSTSAAGAPETASAELGEDAGRVVLRLRSEVKQVLTLYGALQAELIARSSPDYCQPK